VKAISGVQTVRFRKELERNITIKLGYANAKIYKCAAFPRRWLLFSFYILSIFIIFKWTECELGEK